MATKGVDGLDWAKEGALSGPDAAEMIGRMSSAMLFFCPVLEPPAGLGISDTKDNVGKRSHCYGDWLTGTKIG